MIICPRSNYSRMLMNMNFKTSDKDPELFFMHLDEIAPEVM